AVHAVSAQRLGAVTMDTTVIAVATGAAMSVLLLVLAVTRAALSQDILVRSRLAALEREGAPASTPTSEAILRGRRSGVLRVIDGALRRSLGTAPRLQLDRAGIRMSLGD